MTKSRTIGRYVDAEVGERLMKAADAFVLGLGSLAFTSLAAGADRAPEAGFIALTVTFFSLFALRSTGLYEPRAWGSGFMVMAKSFAVALIAGLAVVVAVGELTSPLAPQWALYWIILLAIHMPLTRLFAMGWARKAAGLGGFRKRIAIVGGGKAAEQAIRTLEGSRGLDIEIVGLFDDRNDDRSPDSIRRHRKIGRIGDLADYARSNRVDLIIVAIPLSAEARLLQILKRIWELPVDIRISGQASALKLSPKAYSHLGDLPLLAVFDRPLNGWGQFMKDTVDRVIAGFAIIALSPFMAAVALAVRLESKGPVIFRQKRYGFNNELIEVFKFRSMYTDRTDQNASKLVTKGDPRVTKVGRIIRKTSLDELPQLFNVLTGQLSLVGPRPHATQAKAADALYEQVVEGYFARHKVKPGITGWAQINGWRGETDTREKLEQRVKHDLEYIDRWSIGMDLMILARTPFALLKSENAY